MTCKFVNCYFKAIYKFEEEKEVIFCKKHRLSGMMDYRYVKCKKCKVSALYYLPENPFFPEFCKKHSPENGIKMGTFCKECSEKARYKYLGDKYPTYCKKHAPSGTISNRCNKCSEKSCHKYGKFTKNGKLYCRTHKDQDSIRKFGKCEYERCNRSSFYKFKHEEKSRFCKEHSLEGMFPQKVCLGEDCDKIPSYGFPGEKEKKYCYIHRKDGMICLTKKFCEFKECYERAVFNYPDRKYASHCEQHILPGMISYNKNYKNVCSKCKGYAIYGNISDLKRKRCIDHREPGMYNLTKKGCLFGDCMEARVHGELFCESHSVDMFFS